MDPRRKFIATEDILEEQAMQMLKATCEVLNISMEQAAEAFGDYWVNVYALKIYGIHYGNVAGAREFLLKMDEVHVKSTRNAGNAMPPRFTY